MESRDLECLKAKALEIRKLTIDEIGYLGVGPIGGAMSVVEVLTLLYYRLLNNDPKNPGKEDRDRLVLSKGHAGPALYAVLSDRGFFRENGSIPSNRGGTNLPSHCAI